MLDAPVQGLGSGSYEPRDVQLLLSPVRLTPTGVEEKERRIQTGAAHYSEMISEERAPDERYLTLFETACVSGVPRLALEIRSLTGQILERVRSGRLNRELTLCSLVRAGLPYGVLLRRDLARFGVDATHFGVSIIRDRGLDPVAIARVLTGRPANGVVFVDGWTGKGAISAELNMSWRRLTGLDPLLAVIADPCGRADLCASREDWLIPSGLLGGVVTGLISRTVMRPDLSGPDAYHGYVPLDHLAKNDLTRVFVDRIDTELARLPGPVRPDPDTTPERSAPFRERADRTIGLIADQFGIGNRNRIKPGLAEATRAVLRRRPDRVLVRSVNGDPDLAALLHLCDRAGVSVTPDPELTGPYRAITLIRKAD